MVKSMMFLCNVHVHNRDPTRPRASWLPDLQSDLLIMSVPDKCPKTKRIHNLKRTPGFNDLRSAAEEGRGGCRGGDRGKELWLGSAMLGDARRMVNDRSAISRSMNINMKKLFKFNGQRSVSDGSATGSAMACDNNNNNNAHLI